MTGSDAIGLTMGVYDTRRCRSTSTCTAGTIRSTRSRTTSSRRVRRLVPEPPVADRRAPRRSIPNGARPTPAASGARRQRDADRTSRSTPRPSRRRPADRPLTATCAQAATLPAPPTGSPAATTPSTRCSRPTIRPRAFGAPAAAADRRRRSATGSAPRASTGRGTRAAGRTPTATSARPGWTNGTRAATDVLPTRRRSAAAACRCARTARTSCSSTTTSRSTTTRILDRDGGGRRIAPRTSRDEVEFRTRRPSSKTLRPQAGQLRQADRRRRTSIPGYASEPNGSDHLVDLLQAIEGSECAKDTMVIVTYDEFGGQWDHVSPPGQGTRRPARHLGPGHAHPGAGHRAVPEGRLRRRQHPARHDVDPGHDRAPLRRAPLGTRDAAVNDLSTVFDAHTPS